MPNSSHNAVTQRTVASAIQEDNQLLKDKIQQQQQQRQHFVRYRQERELIQEAMMQRKTLSGMVMPNANFNDVTTRLHELSLKSNSGSFLTEFELLWLQTLRTNQKQELVTKLNAMKQQSRHNQQLELDYLSMRQFNGTANMR